MTGFKFKKAVQALNLLARLEGGQINKMKALKLIWLADRYHLRKYARTIIGDTYFAMEYGPVASGTKDLAEGKDFVFQSQNEREYRDQFLSTISQYYYKSVREVDYQLFSKTDETAIRTVYKAFGMHDEFKLSELSHLFPEWKKFESSIRAGISRVEMNYLDFFEQAKHNVPLFNESQDDVGLTKEIFLENEKMSS